MNYYDISENAYETEMNIKTTNFNEELTTIKEVGNIITYLAERNYGLSVQPAGIRNHVRITVVNSNALISVTRTVPINHYSLNASVYEVYKAVLEEERCQ